MATGTLERPQTVVPSTAPTVGEQKARSAEAFDSTAVVDPPVVLDQPEVRDTGAKIEHAVQLILALEDLDERQLIVNRIQKSLDEDRELSVEQQAEVDAAWRAEFRRRIDDIESGRVQLLDHDEMMAQLRAELAARQAHPLHANAA